MHTHTHTHIHTEEKAPDRANRHLVAASHTNAATLAQAGG